MIVNGFLVYLVDLAIQVNSSALRHSVMVLSAGLCCFRGVGLPDAGSLRHFCFPILLWVNQLFASSILHRQYIHVWWKKFYQITPFCFFIKSCLHILNSILLLLPPIHSYITPFCSSLSILQIYVPESVFPQSCGACLQKCRRSTIVPSCWPSAIPRTVCSSSPVASWLLRYSRYKDIFKTHIFHPC